MFVGLHLCGPKGEGQRVLLDQALAMLQRDNEFVIQAMLRAGRPVPDCIEELGLRYVDDTVADPESGRQIFYSFRHMLERKKFSCGDAAGFEAAVLTQKFQVPARAHTKAGRPRWPLPPGVTHHGLWHSVYETPAGEVDPVMRFLTGQRRAG